MGNGILYKIKGKCEARLQMYDETNRGFTDIWYVSDIKNNLILLGVMASKSI